MIRDKDLRTSSNVLSSENLKSLEQNNEPPAKKAKNDKDNRNQNSPNSLFSVNPLADAIGSDDDDD